MTTPFVITSDFCVPFVMYQHSNASDLNSKLRTLLLAREAEGDVHRHKDALVRQPKGLFESNFRFFDWPDLAVQELRKFCLSTLFRAVASLNGYNNEDLSSMQVRVDAWFHITRFGGYFGTHNHPNASWSGVYCVDSGDDSSSEGDSGVLSFPNPIQMSSVYVDPGNSRFIDRWSTGAREFKLQPGQIILFPSWLQHQVYPYNGKRERITVAFNTQFMAGK